MKMFILICFMIATIWWMAAYEDLAELRQTELEEYDERMGEAGKMVSHFIKESQDKEIEIKLLKDQIAELQKIKPFVAHPVGQTPITGAVEDEDLIRRGLK